MTDQQAGGSIAAGQFNTEWLAGPDPVWSSTP
jgi:hypothetical protein